ncbi:TPA: LysR substrate-binding domain-containing protein, partial [Pseudomonas aeruginosa]
IEAGLGFACVPESFVARMPSTRRGFHAEPVAGLDSSDIHFVWRKQQASPLIQGFIDSIGAD